MKMHEILFWEFEGQNDVIEFQVIVLDVLVNESFVELATQGRDMRQCHM